MHDYLPRLPLPHGVVVIVAEHDLLYVPHTHYRLPGPVGRGQEAAPPPIRPAAITSQKPGIFECRLQRP